MCQTCGCNYYLKQGKDAVFKRAVEIARQLRLTAENAPIYEDGETICGILGPRISLTSPEAAEVWDVVKTVHSFHERIHEEKRKAALKAAQDVFNNFPVKGNPKEILILWQQLESLHHELSDEMIDSLKEPSLQAALKAMRTVHQGTAKRKAEFIKKYKLESS